MDGRLSPARQARAQYRHPLHTLTYVTLDQANGGVVRNLTQGGIGAQVVAAVQPRQQLHVRFELKYPRVRIETRGEVVWATFSGQCGIRFVDPSPRVTRQIKEWIFENLLEEFAVRSESAESIFAQGMARNRSKGNNNITVEEDDGLILSATPLKVIELPTRPQPSDQLGKDPYLRQESGHEPPQGDYLDWLSQPLSGRSLAWAVHTLVVFAGMLLFALVFLSVTREAPRWPFAMAAGAACIVAALYWMFFQILGGASLGTRLARLTPDHQQDEEQVAESRFR